MFDWRLLGCNQHQKTFPLADCHCHMNYPPNQTLINSFVLHLFIWGPVSGVFKIRGKRYCVLKRVLFAVAMGSMGCYSMLQLDMPQASTSSKAIAPQIRAKYPAVMTWCHLCCDLSDQIASKYGMGQNMSKQVNTYYQLLPYLGESSSITSYLRVSTVPFWLAIWPDDTLISCYLSHVTGDDHRFPHENLIL